MAGLGDLNLWFMLLPGSTQELLNTNSGSELLFSCFGSFIIKTDSLECWFLSIFQRGKLLNLRCCKSLLVAGLLYVIVLSVSCCFNVAPVFIA